MEAEPDGAAELAMHLSRRLSLDLAALLQGRLEPQGAVSRVAYKHGAQTHESALAPASYIASSLAQAVLASMTQPYRPLPTDLVRLQTQARDRQDGVLGFDGLLSLCWSHGIPVIPLPHLPVGVRKMDGAALQIGDRPVIVLAKKKSSRAWLSFILAHEMGHIVCGHLHSGSSIVDISLQESAEYTAESSQDVQEHEADSYALEVLGGAESAQVVARWPRNASAVELAVLAREAAGRLKVEPGHFILRNAFNTKRWADAVIALRFLSEDINPEAALLAQLREHLVLDRVAQDLQDLVSHVTGWDRSHAAD
jgi:hypothetical protein